MTLQPTARARADKGSTDPLVASPLMSYASAVQYPVLTWDIPLPGGPCYACPEDRWKAAAGDSGALLAMLPAYQRATACPVLT